MPVGYIGQQSLCTTEELIGDVQNLTNVKSLLDVGCGAGAFSIYMSENVPALSITAIDNDNIAIAEAVANANTKRQIVNINYMIIDMDEWHSSTNYDVIFSADVVQHSRSPVDLLDRLLSMWSARGPFGVSVWWFGNNQAGKSLAHRWGSKNGASFDDYNNYVFLNDWPVTVVNNTSIFLTRLESSLESLLEIETSFRHLYGNEAFENRLSLEKDTVRAVRSGIMGQAHIIRQR